MSKVLDGMTPAPRAPHLFGCADLFKYLDPNPALRLNAGRVPLAERRAALVEDGWVGATWR